MKKLLPVILLLIGQVIFAQKKVNINSDNYYDYYCDSYDSLQGTRLTTDWIRLDDAVPVILDELKKAGYDWLYDRTIFRLANGQHFNITAYSRKSNIGFLYIEGHNLFPSKEERGALFQKDNSGVQFTECEETAAGEPIFESIKSIPSNVYILKEDCYFFQYTNRIDDNKRLVTKEDALKILRQDIRTYLKKAPKP